MLILNRNAKDYYDWYCSVLGTDETTVYDRRDYHVLGGDNFNQSLREIFQAKPSYTDKKKQPLKGYYQSNSIAFRKKIKEEKDKATSWRTQLKIGNKERRERVEGKIYHLILEVGNTHYCFEIERYLDDKDDKIVHIDPTLILIKDNIEQRYGGECPLSIINVTNTAAFFLLTDSWRFIKNLNKDYIINNPILTNTFIPSFIPPEEIWRKIYDYLSSLKDKPIIDSRTNNEHIESAGFDKKDSFRPNKKS